MVGDSLFDLQAAEEAGIKRVFLISLDRNRFPPSGAEVIPSLQVLQQRFEMMLGNEDEGKAAKILERNPRD